MLKKAQELAENGLYEESWEILKGILNQNPNDAHALIAASFVMQKVGNYPVAYHFAKANVAVMKDRPEPYMNLANVCDSLYLVDEGLDAARAAVTLADNDHLKAIAYQNLSALYINNGRYAEAEEPCNESLKLRPDHPKGRGNLGMVQLARGQWKEGWENYSACLGTNERIKQDYGLPEWNGEPGKVLVYGEQGVGDEISFASMIDDLRKTNTVEIACANKLRGLFARSFNSKTHDLSQVTTDCQYQIAVGELGKWFRNRDEDFPGTPYLTPDPDRVLMWKALFATKKKPVIGIAWTGGAVHTGARHRQLQMSHLRRLVNGIDAHWASLEYKPRQVVPKVVTYPQATLTKDYDDTAALVASCDAVITMQTAVAHLAGALGVPCWVMVPETSQWRYAPEKYLWCQKDFYVCRKAGAWEPVIDRIIRDFRRLQKNTAKAA